MSHNYFGLNPRRTFRGALAPLALLIALSIPFGTASAQGNRAADENTFHEFEQIVADFSPPERVQAWEAFIQKYPSSSFVPKVKEIIAELRGEKPATAASRPVVARTPYTSDPDLDFLNDSASATPTPQATPEFVPIVSATPRPQATRKPNNTTTSNSNNSLLDSPPANNRVASSAWSETPVKTGSGKTESFVTRPPRKEKPPVRNNGIGKANHTEVAVAGAFAPDETYVRNILGGVTATQRFGRTWAISLEGYGAQASETALLASLRNLDAEPEVITKYNWMVGGGIEANLLSAIDRVTGQIPNRNDIFVRVGGGVVNADLEICKQEGTQQCASPLFISGVSFSYLTAGVGHRFFFTRSLAIKTEVRGRLVMELIDGVTTPRANLQINLGPSFTF